MTTPSSRGRDTPLYQLWLAGHTLRNSRPCSRRGSFETPAISYIEADRAWSAGMLAVVSTVQMACYAIAPKERSRKLPASAPAGLGRLRPVVQRGLDNRRSQPAINAVLAPVARRSQPQAG
jgi:hypothetical protein